MEVLLEFHVTVECLVLYSDRRRVLPDGVDTNLELSAKQTNRCGYVCARGRRCLSSDRDFSRAHEEAQETKAKQHEKKNKQRRKIC